MTQKEIREATVRRFEACESKRAEARAAALAEGKSEDDARDARDIAHEAAKARWNAWAEPLLAERKAMEASGVWAAEKNILGSLEPKNEQTRDCMERATADFSRCLFLLRGAEGTAEGTVEAAGEDKDKAEASEPPVKSIAIDNTVIDFRGFVFPGRASFDSAASARSPSTASSGSAGYPLKNARCETFFISTQGAPFVSAAAWRREPQMSGLFEMSA
jgi:hypothetical protein